MPIRRIFCRIPHRSYGGESPPPPAAPLAGILGALNIVDEDDTFVIQTSALAAISGVLDITEDADTVVMTGEVSGYDGSGLEDAPFPTALQFTTGRSTTEVAVPPSELPSVRRSGMWLSKNDTWG
jgi:hypothetical protein